MGGVAKTIVFRSCFVQVCYFKPGGDPNPLLDDKLHELYGLLVLISWSIVEFLVELTECHPNLKNCGL